jgi:mycothiol synthase
MVHRLANLPVDRPLPASYVVRHAGERDAEGIGQVLEAAFGVAWPAENVHRELLHNSTVPATFVIENEGRIVATASYQLKPDPDLEAGWLHWVGALPSEKGKGLGEIVSRRVLQEAVDRKRSAVYLSTDDFRIPAIRTYLRLGFEPDPIHESHPARWTAVLRMIDKDASRTTKG